MFGMCCIAESDLRIYIFNLPNIGIVPKKYTPERYPTVADAVSISVFFWVQHPIQCSTCVCVCVYV